MNKRWFENLVSPEGIASVFYIALWTMGITGVVLTLFLGRVLAAIVVAMVCVGIGLRFKRGRVKRVGE